MKCFLDDVEQVIKNSQDYYSPFKNKPSTRERELTSPWECYKKGHAEIVDMLDRGRRVQVIDGKVWTRCEVKASWCDGQYFNATHPYYEDVYNYDRSKPWLSRALRLGLPRDRVGWAPLKLRVSLAASEP